MDKPDIFVSSSANRALHTAMIFAENFNYPLANLLIKKSLYSFSDGYLVKTIMGSPGFMVNFVTYDLSS